MINKWFRNLNQNWRNIITVIAIIVFSFIVFRTIVAIYRINKNNENEAAQNRNSIKENTLGSTNIQQNSKNNNINYSSNSDLLSDEQKALETFVEYCNNKQIDEAYQMLSDECKEEIFPTVEYFNKNYIQLVFNEKRTAKLQVSMYGDTIYQISYYGDLLSSGGYNQSGVIEDYVYFTKKNNEIKLSINQFLYSNTLEKTAENDDIFAKVTKKNVYIDYEVYDIEFTNKTDEKILLSTRKNTKGVVLVDGKNVEYTSNIDEQSLNSIVINPQEKNVLSIKFTRMYNEQREESKTIKFSDIVVNYDEYIGGEEAQIKTLEIEL